MQKEMTEDQKSHYACDLRDIEYTAVQQTSRRGSELSDEFNRLEVQIATIIFAFASLFVRSFREDLPETFTPLGETLMRLGFTASIFFLILSLILGLLHIKRKEFFWDEALKLKGSRFRKWNDVVQNKSSYEAGIAFHEGTRIDGSTIISSPNWTWILQTIFLCLGVALLFILFVVLLFS